LKFNVRYKANYALNRSMKECMRPMRFDTMKAGYPDMHREIMLHQTIRKL
jgi:hypothetical protein